MEIIQSEEQGEKGDFYKNEQSLGDMLDSIKWADTLCVCVWWCQKNVYT